MRRTPRVLAALLTASLAVAPAFVPEEAWARGGRGASMGSRGSRTYSAPPATNTAPGGGTSFQRSMTPQAAPSYATPAARPASGLSRGGAFTSGLLGGLIGAGIGGLLLGHGLTGGLGGFFSFIGLALQLLLLFFVARWLYRRFAGGGRPALATAGGPVNAGGAMTGGAMMREAQPLSTRPMLGGVAAQNQLAITKPDYEAFEQNLKGIQAAWSAQDMLRIQALTTPEMAGYFNEQLSDLASRGLRNTTSDVRLDRGDLAEAWTEGGRDYATVAMNFSMLDVTRDAGGRVIEGDAAARTQATELWTFVRASGGRWILSAIQQAA